MHELHSVHTSGHSKDTARVWVICVVSLGAAPPPTPAQVADTKYAFSETLQFQLTPPVVVGLPALLLTAASCPDGVHAHVRMCC